ncbi:AraC family transcriptional regulator [Paenibacillus filicis]|uniref:AraC family transcriptional regulator n=1 Tax=Paenibacillus gyeongsangnamensis TaxID=3388067 RepID=A0ABT4QGV0_9BACL|nr:AraC family transcriptional regulator [Paenibacillus filicis]MCZ8516117.1 AraC family transcriptional regulator [Paenibacillus filicis]
MLKLFTRTRGTIFWTTIKIIMLICCVPFILTGSIFYFFGSEVISNEVNKAHSVQLEQSIQQIDEYLSGLEKFVVRVSLDPTFDESLNRLDFSWEFEKTKDLLKSLSLMKESNSLLSNVALYLRGANVVIGDESGLLPIQTEEDQDLFSSLMLNQQTIYWDYSLKLLNKPGSSLKAVVVKLPGDQLKGSFGAFLLYLDQNKINSMVRKLASGEGVSYLINENGVDLTTDRQNDQKERKELMLALMGEIKERPSGETNFKFEWKKEKYSVFYGSISKLGGKWTVISATPISQIVAPVTFTTRMIVEINVICLVLGLVVSWIASNKIYAPILRLKSIFESGKSEQEEEQNEILYIENQWRKHLDEKELIRSRMEQSIPSLRDNYLLQFLQGNLYFHTEAEVVEQLCRVEWDVRNKRFAFLVAQLHGISDLGDKYGPRDSQLLTFAASNILSEICSQNLKMTHIINFQDLSVGAFLVSNHGSSYDQFHQEVYKSGRAFVSAVNNVLKLNVTVVASNIVDAIAETPAALEMSRKALRFRDLHASNQILDMKDFMAGAHRHTVKYPFELERDIVYAISSGLEEEAVGLIRQFLSIVVEQSEGTELIIQQSMMKLLGAIQDLIIRYDINIYDMYDGVHLYEQLMHIHEPEEMLNWFQHKLIQPFIRMLSITYDSGIKLKMEQFLAELKSDYLSNTSLETYAEKMNMSPSKLSKAFKQFTGENFIDYIVKLKLEHCKELLVHSELKINEISELLNYQPSYLIRIFKKYAGMTPGLFREKYRGSV